MKTEELLNLLVADLPNARPRFPRILVSRLLWGVLVAVLLLFAAIHVRHDIGSAIGDPRIWLKFDFTLSLVLASLGLAQRSGEPGVPWGYWGYALLVAPALLFVGVAIECYLTPASSWASRLVGANAKYCLMLVPLLAAGPLAGALLALREGAPTNPGLSGAIAGLLAGGVGAALYATHCPDDSPLFLATWYPLAIGLVVLVGFVVGSRVLRW